MHHVVLEQWSRGGSWLHRRDARAKVLAALALLIAIATAPWPALPGVVTLPPLLCLAAYGAGLPVLSVLSRASVVLPFCAVFAAISLLLGEWQRAALLAGKGYLSSLTVVVLAGVTPLPQLLRGLERLGVPRFLLLVAQFVYRYLFVIAEQAQHMRLSAWSRGGFTSRQGGFRAAAGALAILFSRSFDRAERVHRAMLARGFDGRLPVFAVRPIGAGDLLLLVAAISLSISLRWFPG